MLRGTWEVGRTVSAGRHSLTHSLPFFHSLLTQGRFRLPAFLESPAAPSPEAAAGFPVLEPVCPQPIPGAATFPTMP